MKGSKHYTDYTGAGIYALVNTDDGIAYIGKSQNISKRCTMHRSNFKRKADCAPFYKYESSEYILNLLVFNAGRNTYSAFIDNLGFNPYMLVYTNRKKTKEQVRKTGS